MKKVRVAEKLTVHVMYDWPQAFREARRSTRLLKALNRRRFKRQIHSTALQI